MVQISQLPEEKLVVSGNDLIAIDDSEDNNVTKKIKISSLPSSGGSGDMTKVVYDPTNVVGDAFDMDNMVEGVSAKILTSSERTLIASAIQPLDNVSTLTNDAGYLTSYTETDPVYSASQASNITVTDITNLSNLSGVNTGDQDLSGYVLTSSIDTLAELNTVVTDATLIDTSDSRLSDARTPLSHTHVEANITDLKSYLLNINGEVINDLSDVVITTPADGELFVYDTTTGKWINNTLAEAGVSAVGHTHVAANITDFDTEVSNNSSVTANTAKVSNATHTGDATGDTALSVVGLRGVGLDSTVGSPSDGDILVYRSAGTDWVLEAKPAGGSNPALNDITDVTIVAVADNELLAYDTTSGEWINQTPIEAGFSTVATTGAYSDLSGTPTIPTLTSELTNDSGFITSTLTNEQVQDIAGAMVTGNTETLITVTYQDIDGTLDFVVDNDLSHYDNTTSGFTTNVGTVTSVGVSVPTGLEVFSGSPVTTSGTIAVVYAAGYVGYTTAEASKLSGIESGAEVNNISDVNVTDLTDGGDSSLHYHSVDRSRSNHTGTQTASTISDFDTEVSNNSSVVANTAKVGVTTQISNVVEDTTPQLGGSLDAQDNHITGVGTVGFTQELDNGSKTASFSVDFGSDQKQKVTLTANTMTLTLDTTFDRVGNYLLKVVNGGLATLTWASETGGVYWAGGTVPTLTSSGVDIVTFYYDGADWYGVASLNFS